VPLTLSNAQPNQPSRRPIVASGKQLDLTATANITARSGVPVWQQQAWSYYDQIGEVRYGARFFGNSLSRLRMFLGWRERLDAPIVPIDVDELPAGADRMQAQVGIDSIARLHNTDGSMAGLLRQYGVNTFVAGESYLVGRTDRDSGLERWEVLSVDQVVMHEGRWKIRQDVADTPDKYVALSGEDDVVLRVWQPHPRFAQQADAPMRAVLPLCEELLLLSASVRASALSRMSAGVLVLPDTALDGGPMFDEGGSGFDGEGQADPLLQDMMNHFTEPIGDPASAAAVAPYILAMDPQDCDKVKLLETSRSVDETAAAQRAEVLVRLANGVDLPPEVLQGMSNTNHWNAWLIDEQSYKSHIAPAAQLFADAVTEGLVWPAIRAVTGSEPDVRLVVGFDPANLVGHADVRGAAKDGHSALVLSDEALRRALGFSEDDAPGEDELLRRVSIRSGTIALAPAAVGEAESVAESITISKSASVEGETDEQVEAVEGPDDGGGVDEVEPGPPEAEGLTAAAFRPTDLGDRLGRIDRQLLDRLQVLGEQAVRRALDRAGARVRSKLSRQPEWRDTLKATDNRGLVAAVGEQTVFEVGLDDDELLAGSFDEVADDFDLWVARAQRRARQLLVEDYELGDDEATRLEETQDERRGLAAALFVAGLAAVAVSRLYPGRPGSGVDAVPGVSPVDGVPGVSVREVLRADNAVPVKVTRDAMTVAGGGTPSTTAGTVAGGGQPAGLVATGSDVVEAAQRVGLVQAGFIWSYGDDLRDTFEPHFVLDGREFSGWDDPGLVNNEGWPAVSHFFPGDHDFCRCESVPIFRVTVVDEG